MRASGKYTYVPEQLIIDLLNIIKEQKVTRKYIATLLDIPIPTFNQILTRFKLRCTEDTWFKITNFLKPRVYEKRFAAEEGTTPNRACTQRNGLAHLCINGKLICGNSDYNRVRYYRAHEEWLNQVEICPKCLSAWQKAEAIWNKNQ